MTAAAMLATRRQLTRLAILYGECGMADRQERLDHASRCTGRSLTSSAELTEDEARTLIALLTERRRPRGRARCNLDGQPLSPGDQAAVDAFAELLGGQVAASPTPGPDGGCGPDGRHVVPVGEGVQSCPCGMVTRHPRGRYCPPAICWCGHCPWWTPAPPVNYAAAVAQLHEKTQGRRR